MKKHAHGPLSPRYLAGVKERLSREGVAPEVAAALLTLDSAVFQWHRMAVKGDLPARLVAEMGVGLEPSQFFALTAVMRIECGIGRPAPEAATVGLLAEELAIDPSRASRIASELIASGFLRREADQNDGRKTILRMTEHAGETMANYRELKWTKILDVFDAWEDDEITCFSRLFMRYVEGIRGAYGIGCASDD
ncbi:MarR family winged helix-turn-helix transcriptional regulator [Tropicimonas sp. IMCC34043]|uniref:MarR family winged helix-turn-helix transcriptional regulator n=1 Tax=Tropicimonas sp. IMCC34043 TaxID=2248760 RepID=UPI000E267B5D|nr:MarR family winged helix-turn-helix transcriptional regulator [Tropicimonas sp. IMCC34043]